MWCKSNKRAGNRAEVEFEGLKSKAKRTKAAEYYFRQSAPFLPLPGFLTVNNLRNGPGFRF